MSDGVGEVRVRGYRVHGRVQGVGFRWWTQRTGIALGLTGHVRNLRGGGVEVHARGFEDSLALLEGALLEGPPMAEVDRVERIDADARTPESGFLMETW